MKKFSAAALAVIALAATAIPALAGGWQGNYDRQVAKVRAGFELGYVSAEPEGDDLCVPPRDMIKAGYAPRSMFWPRATSPGASSLTQSNGFVPTKDQTES